MRVGNAMASLKTARTRLDTHFRTVAIDDVGHTEEGKRLRKELWIAQQKIHGLIIWLGRIRRDYLASEVVLRDKKKLEALGVNPEEVLNRGVS